MTFKVFYRAFKYDMSQWYGHRFYVVDQETYDTLRQNNIDQNDIVFSENSPDFGKEVHIGRYLSAGYGVDLPLGMENDPSYTEWAEYPYEITSAEACIWDDTFDEIDDIISIPLRPVEEKEQ
jgi:hypothetical protein